MFTLNQTLPYVVNEGKQLVVHSSTHTYHCYAVKTSLVLPNASLEEVIATYAAPLAQPGDIIFISEKMVACTQGRALPLTSIKPGFWANTLSRHVSRCPGGIGLGMPETMQCAIEECGLPRILLAACAGAIGKLFRQKGWFYHIAGRKAAAIDGPCHWTIPPYNEYVVLSPLHPNETAKALSQRLNGCLTLIVDLNDLGGEILGASQPLQDRAALLALLRQNPLGQSAESTPIGILRPVG